MPKKPEKWGVKLWVLADLVTKYVSDFHVYCGKNEGVQDGRGTAIGAYSVVMGLLA